MALLFGVSPLDAVALTTAPALILVVAGAASVIPACRSARIDPIVSLRPSNRPVRWTRDSGSSTIVFFSGVFFRLPTFADFASSLSLEMTYMDSSR